MENYHIFIVEDDPWYGEILAYHLGLNPDYSISRFHSAKECLDKLNTKPDLITLDIDLPDMPGDQLFLTLKEKLPTVPIVVISGQEDVSVAVKLLKLGVSDYLVKDEATKDLLWHTIIRIRENQHLRQEVAALREELGQKYAFKNTLIGQSAALESVFDLMEKAARTQITVSISGETGTGKELVAKAIHHNSERKKKPFVAVNMAAIPKELIESELFGHEKGAFTGALGRKAGKFEEANGGTLFLDEIAEMEISLQSKLLRVLQERELERVGGNEKVKLDIRLVVATHKNLLEEVRQGRFREDLYYRLLGLPIQLPPLRERGADVLLLAKNFIDAFAKENKLGTLRLSAQAKEKLLGYSFPGNIRELKAVVELAAVLCSAQEIQVKDLQLSVAVPKMTSDIKGKTLRELTCEHVQAVLDQTGGDVLEAARLLDIGKSTIYKMIKEGEVNP